ncbi:MAG: crossover junction endodeoxyribonuclease RuvC [Oscillospiraceae bacterium]|nr:crossover junction endodeoxyribonuclease RuvC [Oscillospiraceae bacterium]
MVILGIDPGVATVGFGIITEINGVHKLQRYGVITTPSNQRLSYRLKQINNDMTELIKAFKPDAIAVEELFFNTNLKTAVVVSHGRAAILLAGEENGIPMYEYTPLQVKKAIAGYGRATKKQVTDMVKRLLELEVIPKPDDAADALAIAICHARFAKSRLNPKSNKSTI